MFRAGRFARALGSTNVTRLDRFSKLESRDVDFFKSVCNVYDGDMERYNQDWLKMIKGNSQLALRPKTTEEVSKILKYCNERRLAVCTQGGNTGLVGGCTPVFDEIILSMELMNKTLSIDPNSGVAIFEAGVVLEAANNQLQEEAGLIFPLDLGAKGSCQIGGNIATNAGGLRVLRYGNLHGSVLGLEFVSPTGEIVDVLSRNKKDNTGIDLKQLLIGSEGILGVITKAAIKCPPVSRSMNVVLLGVPDYKAVVETFQHARTDLGEILSAFEFFDQKSIYNLEHNLGLQIPEFLQDQKFGIVIETSGSNDEHDVEKLFSFLETHGLENGSVAASSTQFNSFWQLREDIPEAMMKDGALYAYDVNLPEIENLYLLIEETKEQLEKTDLSSKIKQVVGYGHVGDGNVHLNITTEKFETQLPAQLEPWLWQRVEDLGGSISAEHGIGSCKTEVIHHSRSTESLKLMRDIKETFDPNGILNPYKVICDQAARQWPAEKQKIYFGVSAGGNASTGNPAPSNGSGAPPQAAKM